jgi:hypothetical protein
MKTQTLGWLVGLGAALCSFASCTQPATPCQVGLAGFNPFAVVLTPMGSPSGAGCGMNSPRVVQTGELVGMEDYDPPSATSIAVAIKTDSMGSEYSNYTNFSCTPLACAAGCAADADCNPDSTVNQGLCDSGACKCVSSADCNNGAPCTNGHCGINCGPMADGCGNLALPPGGTGPDCGGCPSGQTCGGGGMPSVCGSGATCMPMTCADLMFTCGLAGDGCGGMLDCGTCADPADSCGGAGVMGQCGHIVPDPDTSHALYALGSFSSQYPDASDLCTVTGLSAARTVLSSGPTPSAAFPTSDVENTWSNVKVYVTAAAQGTQFSGDVTYTVNGCSATYHAVGVWPAHSCTTPVLDPTDPQQKTILGQAPDNDLCNPCAQPDKGLFVGSGINPDFPVTCKQIFPTQGSTPGPCMGAGCFSTDPLGRDPWWCVLDGSGDPPILNPNPPTCATNYGG